MSGTVALIFGAFIVVFFAYDRFNRAGYEGSQQFERLVPYLSPDKLRARRIVMRAYLFYAATLLVIYLFLCIYAEVLPQLGAKLPGTELIGATGVGTQNPSGAVTPEGGKGAGISSSVALGVALIMVGLAPSFPILESFEKWLRITAHRLAGIPTRVLESAENLRGNQFGFEDWDWIKVPSRTMLIPAGDWQRMADYDRSAGQRVSDPADFRDNLEVIFAVSAWILDRKLKLADARDRLRFQSLEKALLDRFEALRKALDEKTTTFLPATIESSAFRGSNVKSSASRRSDAAWDRLAREADDLADDLCFLLALYLEHGIIVRGQMAGAVTEDPKTSPGEPNGTAHVSQHQQRLAKARLDAFLGSDGDQPSAHALKSHMATTWLWTLGMVMAVSLVWSQFPGAFEAELQGGRYLNSYQRIVAYTFNGFTTFCIPMMVALALRDGGLQSHHWVNMSLAHWTRGLPQAVGVVVISLVAGTLMLIAARMWELSIIRADFNINTAGDKMGFQFAYSAPATLRGAILALIAVVLLDAHQAGALSSSERPTWKFLTARPTWKSSLSWAILSAVTMAFGGGIARAMTSQAALAWSPTSRSFDSVDRGLILYSALYSAIIGFFVVFCVAEYLLNPPMARGRARRDADDAPPGTAAAKQGMRGLLHRLHFRVVILALALASLAPAPAFSETVRIGARVDARPFIWKDGETGNYLGFLWDICTEAVQRAGYTVDPNIVEVEAKKRTAFLEKGEGGFDLLCDPTTITLERMRNFAPRKASEKASGGTPKKALGLAFTQIVFVANASYVANPAGRGTLSGNEATTPPACETLIARISDDDLFDPPEREKPDSFGAWLRSKVTLRPEWLIERQPKRSIQFWGYFNGSTSQKAAEEQIEAENEADEKDAVYPAVTCLYPLESHDEAAKLYCEGRLNRYYGDIEIVRAAIADYRAPNGGICKSRQVEGTEITYEPYAFVVSSLKAPDLPEQITLALYSMFGDGTIERLFAGYFPKEPKSEPLAELFLLNSIPLGIEAKPDEVSSAPASK